MAYHPSIYLVQIPDGEKESSFDMYYLRAYNQSQVIAWLKEKGFHDTHSFSIWKRQYCLHIIKDIIDIKDRYTRGEL